MRDNAVIVCDYCFDDPEGGVAWVGRSTRCEDTNVLVKIVHHCCPPCIDRVTETDMMPWEGD
jgi:hypothetical protein